MTQPGTTRPGVLHEIGDIITTVAVPPARVATTGRSIVGRFVWPANLLSL